MIQGFDVMTARRLGIRNLGDGFHQLESAYRLPRAKKLRRESKERALFWCFASASWLGLPKAPTTPREV
jgi:hypothetical protein